MRGAGPRFSFWMKAMQATTLAIAVCFSLGATDASSRFNDLGHRMMCTCGCAQLLGECNHVGCPNSSGMRDELSAAIANGSSDKEILAAFSAKYGATVLAAPTMEGFNLVAWIAPFAVFGAATLGTVLLVRRWTADKTQSAVGPDLASLDLASLDPAEQARREKIRRETDTGIEGGS
jgi:cytochrome c-type biogenesis protein CcmH/NrfF